MSWASSRSITGRSSLKYKKRLQIMRAWRVVSPGKKTCPSNSSTSPYTEIWRHEDIQGHLINICEGKRSRVLPATPARVSSSACNIGWHDWVLSKRSSCLVVRGSNIDTETSSAAQNCSTFCLLLPDVCWYCISCWATTLSSPFLTIVSVDGTLCELLKASIKRSKTKQKQLHATCGAYGGEVRNRVLVGKPERRKPLEV